MQSADLALGDFKNASLVYNGITSTFFTDNNRLMARTDGPDGRLHDYPIAYTFGVTPLQQYLVAFPGGRYQALSIAWDARPKAEGRPTARSCCRTTACPRQHLEHLFSHHSQGRWPSRPSG